MDILYPEFGRFSKRDPTKEFEEAVTPVQSKQKEKKEAVKK